MSSSGELFVARITLPDAEPLDWFCSNDPQFSAHRFVQNGTGAAPPERPLMVVRSLDLPSGIAMSTTEPDEIAVFVVARDAPPSIASDTSTSVSVDGVSDVVEEVAHLGTAVLYFGLIDRSSGVVAVHYRDGRADQVDLTAIA
jgi:hypothetical protein